MLSAIVLIAAASATTPRWDFEDAYDNNIPWYNGYDNVVCGPGLVEKIALVVFGHLDSCSGMSESNS